ncbi:unnamed protein product [Cylicocyclus nassatus]|uniref:Peptidase S1 domain-containing protein n=1 Tax=Cylicocyclus nassatus TaxID=53992 RepID=A0AA36M6C6_CYLNA|nr:unnamed protein product [Cylicocyclus nassatus]
MNFLCFLIIIPVAIGHNDFAYDAQTCGISQMNDAAGNPSKARVRRSSTADAQLTNTSIVGNSTLQKLDEDVDNGDNFMEEKIMGGRRAERGELPWAVSLLLYNEYRKGEYVYVHKVNCGGTLVSRRHVITAAHCFNKGSSSSKKLGQCSTSDMYSLEDVIRITKIFIGGTCSIAGKFGCTESDIGKVYRVARASYQKFYEHGCRGNDIAILELTEDVPKTINHVCLPFLHKVEEIEDPYLKLSTFGWGRDPFNHAGKFMTPYLQIADIGRKLPEDVCDKAKPFKAKDAFCNKSGQQHFCQGDSGGGVTATIRGRTYLMGVVSMGPDCERIAERGGSSSLVQISTDIVHHKKTIKKWIMARGRRKFKGLDSRHRISDRLFQKTKKPEIALPYKVPHGLFGKTGKPEIVSPHRLPHRHFIRIPNSYRPFEPIFGQNWNDDPFSGINLFSTPWMMF